MNLPVYSESGIDHQYYRKASKKCSKCGQEHDTKSCTTSNLNIKCANCNGGHRANSFACPEYVKQENKRQFNKINLSVQSIKPGDNTECMRLACSVAAAVVNIVQTRLQLPVSPLEVCNDVAKSISRFYRSDVKGEHVHGLAFRVRNSQAAAANHND